MQLFSIIYAFRCKTTTVNQELGEVSGSNEPLKTLNTYRTYEQVYGKYDKNYTSGPLFGSNFAVVNPGPIRIGDTVFTRPTQNK